MTHPFEEMGREPTDARAPSKRYIEVSQQFEGFHRWRDAPNEVAFLRDTHRHMFHVEVTIEVGHGDREIEFILFKRSVYTVCVNLFQLFEYGHHNEASCERMAERIGLGVQSRYGEDRNLKVKVSEDGENGAVVKWTA